MSMKKKAKLLSTLSKTAISWLSLLCLFSIIVLEILGYTAPLRAFLESEPLTFTIGTISFSVYTIIKTVITLILLLWLANIISATGTGYLKKIKRIKASNRALIIKAFQATIYFLAFMIGLDIMGIDLTAFAVVGGAVGIGIGFGLQKITSNFISGLILLFEKSVEEGDLVELADGTTGFVRNTGARYTLLETFESREIMIPNEDFITNRVTNWTFSNSQGRVDINVGVSYGTDLEKAHQLILEAASEHPRCSRKPQPECYLVGFNDSSVDFTLYFWVDDIIEGRKRPKSDVLFAIWNKFKANGIEIPFPQRDIHIKDANLLR